MRQKPKPCIRPAGRRKSSKPAADDPEPAEAPPRWPKAIAGVCLLPFAWLLTKTFFGAFSRATVEHGSWATDEFWFFGLGAALWTLWFFGSMWSLGEPRPLRAYVFGHELTHAIWVWLCCGKVSGFQVSRDGGYILTDTHNFFIALAPYFYPLYSLVLISLYGVARLFFDIAGSTETFLFMTPLQWLFLLLGATWAFHLTFTCWMIPKGQSDLTYHGTFFSLVVIYVMNVLLLSVFLILVARDVSFAGFARELGLNVLGFLKAVSHGLRPHVSS